MAFSPIAAWQIEGEKMEEFLFLGSTITAGRDCSHEIRRQLLLGRKAMANIDSVLKNRDITLPTKVRIVKAVVFLVVTYGCESWALEKAEHQRVDAFKLEKTPESPLDSKDIKRILRKTILNICCKD